MDPTTWNWPLVANIATASAAVLALASIGVSVLALRRSTSTALRSAQIALLGVQDEYFSHLRGWGAEVVRAIEAAIHLCQLDPQKQTDPNHTVFHRRLELLSELAGLVDRGRWFFPNVQGSPIHGLQKEPAYQGYRHQVISAVAHAYWYVKQINYEEQEPNWQVRDKLVEQERDFTSQLQAVLDPARRSYEFNRLTG